MNTFFRVERSCACYASEANLNYDSQKWENRQNYLGLQKILEILRRA